MSTEKQNQLIRQAISELPDYQAPEQLWPQISEQLDIDQKERLIQRQLAQLPDYHPPETVWTEIAEGLAKAPPKNTWLRLVRQPLTWAASFLLLFSLYWLVTQSQGPEVSYTYTTQAESQWLLESDWDADEADFAEVVQLHQRYLRTFDDQSAASLQEEFDELNTAREEIKETLDRYGKDQELIRQLAAIERARTQIVNQMAQQI
ncbi:MAG TPA: hypothetical protein VJ953_06990 [Saprospiraceae bacterium]|nr:hypothetical protein [Saprospiraceae bacterium]